MDSIESMSYGSWWPSPRSICPLLKKMTEEGLIRRRKDGRYGLVDDAYDEFGNYCNKPNTIESAIREIDSYVSCLEEMPVEKIGTEEDKIAMFGCKGLRIRMHR
ncbi:hypothetical protein [Methanocella conradii]|uniref:hypothetical protein n=1 Tax=Methanocella conradii TaxID=1175444 RepID=UPI0024B34360|nr:hypothetical protein [Methanocella conradii]MDI6896488.1 hypothetical protein [Methanocella conradii]